MNYSLCFIDFDKFVLARLKGLFPSSLFYVFFMFMHSKYWHYPSLSVYSYSYKALFKSSANEGKKAFHAGVLAPG